MKISRILSSKVLYAVLALVVALGLALPVAGPAGADASTNFSLQGYQVQKPLPDFGKTGWTDGNLGKGWKEGYWVPYKLEITNVQTNYENLVGFPDIEIEFDFYSGTPEVAVFYDLVRGIQVSGTYDPNLPPLSDLHGWPTAAGTAQPNTAEGIRAGQTDPDEHAWSGFQLLNLL